MSTVEKKSVGTPSEAVSSLSDDEVIDLYRQFSTSGPIQIPVEKLSPSYAYRWCNKSNPKTWTRRRGLGWQPVAFKELEQLVVKPHTVDELGLGTHVDAAGYLVLSNDLVFCKMPKRYADAIEAHLRQRYMDQAKAGKRRFHQAGELAGVSTFERDPRGR